MLTGCGQPTATAQNARIPAESSPAFERSGSPMTESRAAEDRTEPADAQDMTEPAEPAPTKLSRLVVEMDSA